MIWYSHLLPGNTYKDEINKISVGRKGWVTYGKVLRESWYDNRLKQRARCYDTKESQCDVGLELAQWK